MNRFDSVYVVWRVAANALQVHMICLSNLYLHILSRRKAIAFDKLMIDSHDVLPPSLHSGFQALRLASTTGTFPAEGIAVRCEVNVPSSL